jgi:hypothetical protein
MPQRLSWGRELFRAASSSTCRSKALRCTSPRRNRATSASTACGLRVRPPRGRQELVQVQAQPAADLHQESVGRGSLLAVLDIAEVRGADPELRRQGVHPHAGPLPRLPDAVTQGPAARPVACCPSCAAHGQCRSPGLRKGDAYENALCEVFFATLNREVLRRCRFRTRDEARSVLFAYLVTSGAKLPTSSGDEFPENSGIKFPTPNSGH